MRRNLGFARQLRRYYGIYTLGFAVFVVLLAIGESMGLSQQLIGHVFLFVTIAIYATIGVLSRTLMDDAPAHGSVWLQLPNDPVSYAHRLYRDLRRLDQCGASLLLIEAPPQSAEWRSVNDSLQRAAADREGLPKP